MNNLDFLETLNDKQKLAAWHDEGPALVLAGAGSGKTRVLTSRVARLLMTKNLAVDEILLVTFTNKAALEMKERVRSLTGFDLPMSGTFHSLATKVLRRYAPSIKLDYNFTIYDSDDQLSLLKQIYKNNGWDSRTYKPQAVRAAISEAKNQLLSPAQYRETVYGDFGEFVVNAYESYQRNLRTENALDFDDLLNYCLELLENEAYVRRIYQEKIKYVLVDEYQDTNKVQYRLSKILAAPQNNLFVVGDFSQSIYAWRGADYKNMLTLQEDFKDIKTYHLDQNYRSIQPILTAATQIIAKNSDHPVLNLWTEDKAKSKLELFDCETGDQEARQVAKEIQKLQDQFQLSQMAILYRTNAQSRAFEEALTRAGLPYRLVGGFKFYERKEIKDLLAYLRLTVNNKDSVSLQRTRRIGKRRLDSFLVWRTERERDGNVDEQPVKTLEEILRVTKYRELYDPEEPEEAVKLENINELLAHASQFETITNFLENVALVQDDYGPDSKQKPEEKNQLTMMSLHSAKGLEFEVVFLVGMEENFLPHARTLFDASQLAEERRLCYVGITRAKQKLYLTHARKRWLYGSVNVACRSRFIDDLDQDLLLIRRFEETQESNWQWQKKSQWSTTQISQNLSSNNSSQLQVQDNSKRRIDLDDCQLEEVLSGEIDFETFLRG